jgi:hypothetical protein
LRRLDRSEPGVARDHRNYRIGEPLFIPIKRRPMSSGRWACTTGCRRARARSGSRRPAAMRRSQAVRGLTALRCRRARKRKRPPGRWDCCAGRLPWATGMRTPNERVGAGPALLPGRFPSAHDRTGDAGRALRTVSSTALSHCLGHRRAAKGLMGNARSSRRAS